MFSMLANWTTDMWSPIINLFSFIPSHGVFNTAAFDCTFLFFEIG